MTEIREEQTVREMLREAVSSGEPRDVNAWTEFRRRAARAQRIRAAVVAVAAIAVAVTLTLLLPVLETPDPQIPVPRAAAREPTREYVDRDAGFAVRFPATWNASGLAGRWALFSPEEGVGVVRSQVLRGTLTERAAAFAVTVSAIGPACDGLAALRRTLTWARPESCPEVSRAHLAALEKAGVDVSGRDTTVAGRRARAYALVFPKRPRAATPGTEVVRPPYWCAGCSVVDYVVAWPPRGVLTIHVVAPDDRAFAAAFGRAEALIASLRAVR